MNREFWKELSDKDGAKISRSTLVTPKEASGLLETGSVYSTYGGTRMDTRNERITEEKS